ncbi:MAG: hypothetical protein KBC42_02950 [Candidatus Pacebacteria bacterium]|nr:hypothetical protein [Candidatus Paceibacterota bacterium]MBP9780857.1 hypothetical protein [Candidatus Paceibacterota bacterium]
MTWAGKRQFVYLSLVLLVILGVLFALIYPRISVPATCTDGKKNGAETGVDCGGTCSLMCMSDTRELIVVWARAFEVAPGVYHVAAYIENQNVDAAVKSVPYQFKLYDERNVVITQREGMASILPNGHTVIFEEALSTGGNRIPKITRFEFTKQPIFWKTSAIYKEARVVESDKGLGSLETVPKAYATLRNESFIDVGKFPVIAVVYDQLDNAIGVSRTIVDGLPKQTEVKVNFSWLYPFGKNAQTLEILPIIDPFTLGEKLY